MLLFADIQLQEIRAIHNESALLKTKGREKIISNYWEIKSEVYKKNKKQKKTALGDESHLWF